MAFFKLEPEVLAEVNARLLNLPRETRQAFYDEFTKHSTLVPLRLRYCSMSEKILFGFYRS